MSSTWSWLLTGVGVTGLYFAGKKLWWAWLIGLSAQLLWFVYALNTKQYGFIISSFVYGWVYANNSYNWWLEHNRGKGPNSDA